MLAEFHIFIVAQIDALPPLLRAPDDRSGFPAVALWKATGTGSNQTSGNDRMAGLSAKSQPRCDWFVGNKNGISVSEGAKLAEWQAKSETKIIASIASGKEVDGRVTMIQQKMFQSVYIKVSC